MSVSPIFRFAPTPNGRLHLGHAYSALFNAERARKTNGRLLLRIEDIDLTRSKREFETAILDDLNWLGIVCEPAPRRQSEHVADYSAALGELGNRGLVYPCFCTRGQIAMAAGGAVDPDGAPLHRGRCVGVSEAAIRAKLEAGHPSALRLDMARARQFAPGALHWREFGEGDAEREIEADPDAWGDIMLRGKDRPATYHVAVVVDDALQGVTDVARSRDLFPSTSVHRLLQVLLGFPAPRYRHHRLVLDAGGAKLSKSKSSPPLHALRDQGWSAEDIRAALGFAPRREGGLEVAFS